MKVEEGPVAELGRLGIAMEQMYKGFDAVWDFSRVKDGSYLLDILIYDHLLDNFMYRFVFLDPFRSIQSYKDIFQTYKDTLDSPEELIKYIRHFSDYVTEGPKYEAKLKEWFKGRGLLYDGDSVVPLLDPKDNYEE